MNQEEKVIELISQVTDIPAADLKAHREEEKVWNSLQHVEVVFALEEEFGLTFAPEELARMTSVKAIADVLAEKN